MCKVGSSTMNYMVCEHVDILTKGGGQNKQARKNRGRASGCSTSATIAHIRCLTHNQPSYVDSTDEVEYLPEHVANLLCPICCDTLKQPIKLACGRLVCAHCCCRWIVSPKPTCPGCYTHELDNLTIGLPSAVVYELLGALKLVCGTCKQKTTAAQLKQHKASQCKGHYEVPSPSQISAQEILARPVTAPTQPVERRLAEHLVRRLMTESEDKVVRIPTRGKVRTCVHRQRCL